MARTASTDPRRDRLPCRTTEPGPRLGRSGGFTLIEMAASLLIFAIAASVLVNHLTINYQSTRAERDRVFAYSKAQSILAEIQSFVDRGELGSAVDLDGLDDGVVPVPNLTISTSGGSLLAADSPLSGNSMIQGEWIWQRQITVQPLAGIDNRNVRYVTVRINKRDMAGVYHGVADLSAVVNAAGDGFPTTQVFDVFLLAVENVPGWWVYMDSIRPFVESTITDLETRNPGMEIRTHWITKLGYGRNKGYAPYTNDSNDSHQAFPYAYLYPGRMPSGQASAYYYVPQNMDARMWFDGVEQNGYDAATNPMPYALADWFNHCMRYPEALEFHNQRVALIEQRIADRQADLEAGLDPDANGHPEFDDMSTEPTWRLLLEDMCTNPARFRNALLINLHGELLPMPPLRNYSDAAKAPDRVPGLRVVTHPEQLRFHRDPAGVSSENVVLRTHIYAEDPDNFSPPAWWPGPDHVNEYIGIRIRGINLGINPVPGGNINAAVKLEWMPGGTVENPVFDSGQPEDPILNPRTINEDYTGWEQIRWSGDPSLIPGDPYYLCIPTELNGQLYTYLFVYGARMGARLDSSNRGLFADERSRLYDMEYQPGSPGSVDFSQELDTIGSGPKNTARIKITLSSEIVDGTGDAMMQNSWSEPVTANSGDLMLEVSTFIWQGSWETGVMFPNALYPDNLSKNYVWWTDSADDVPITERSQFLGDPRHMPYKDLLSGDPDFPDRYNWFFDTLDNDSEDSAADYPGLNATYLGNRWDGRARHDVPRLMEVIRTGLTNSNAVYTSLTGWSYYYLGLGNEIGYDSANGYPNSIPVHRGAWGGGATTGYQNNITGSRCLVRESGADYWYSKPWLGELCPDDAYLTSWAVDMDPDPLVTRYLGNLPAGNGAGQYYRERDYDVYWNSGRTAYGTRMYSSNHRLAAFGCTSFMNANNSSATFHHFSNNGTGNLVGPGIELGNNYNFPMPSTAQISRPWDVNRNSGTPPEFGDAPYSGNRFTASLLETYYTHTSGEIGSGLVGLTSPGNTGTAYIVVNGIDKTTETGTSFISKYALLSLVHTYFEAGDVGWTHRIVQPPRVEILFPTDVSEISDPNTLAVEYRIDWSRWDGEPYTQSGIQPAEVEGDLEYVLMYSRDGGSSWLYPQDHSPAVLNQRPDDSTYILSDSVNGDEVFNWSVPEDSGDPATSFPRGTYQLRVECYRAGQELHYAWHQTRFFIQR